MALGKLGRMMQKNFRLLLRSRSSALIVVLGPLLLISLIGLAFSNSNPYGVVVASYAPEYNDLSNSVLATLNEQQFKVERIISEEACVQRVKQSKANICLVFPEDFTVGDSANNNITFHVDYSKINLVWSVLDVISEKISSRTTEISKDLTGQLVKALEHARGEVEQNLPNVVDLSVKNSQVLTLTDDVTKTINGMELSLDTKEFKVETLQGRVELLVDTADKATDKGLKIISDIKDNYDAYNLSASQQVALSAVFDEAKGDLESLKDSLADLYAEGNQSSLIGDLLRGLSIKLQETKEQLTAAVNAREVVIGDAKNIKALTDSGLEKINLLQASLDDIQKSIEAIAITDPTKIVNPITTTIKPITVDTHFNYLFPSLIVLIIMITGVLLSAMLVIVEKKSTAFFRNFITPTHELVFLAGTFCTALVLMLAQLVIFLIVAGVFFDTNVFPTFATTAPVLLVINLLFIALGMLLGAAFRSEETTILAAISCCALLLFLSSTILPLESMPPVLQRIADFNPFVMSEELLRETIIFGFGYNLVAGELLMLFLYAAVFFVLVAVLTHFLKIRTLYKIHKEKPQKKRMAETHHWWSHKAAVQGGTAAAKHSWKFWKKS